MQFSPSRMLVAERHLMKRCRRVALCLAPLLLGVLVFAFGASRLRPHARTPFCFADAATAHDVLHSSAVIVSPSPIHFVPSRAMHPVLRRILVAQTIIGETVAPWSLRAPPVFRI